jgi:hypothetical protein
MAISGKLISDGEDGYDIAFKSQQYSRIGPHETGGVSSFNK